MKITDRELAVLRALHGARGTWEQITQRTGLKASTVSPRLAPLRRKGLIEYTGLKIRRQSVWRITNAGRMEVARHTDRVVHGEENLTVFRVPEGALSNLELDAMPPGQIIEVLPGITAQMVDRLSDAQWREILNGNMNMKGYVRIRMKRAIRLLTEGKVYDDETEKSHHQSRVYA